MAIEISLKKLRSFCAVAELGGFGAAAEKLGIPQSTLSGHIADLEVELRSALVWRTTRRVRLTPSGKRFLLRAQHALADLENAALELRDQSLLQRGRVVLACMPTVASSLAPAAISAFSAKYPLVSIDLIDQPSRMVEGSVLNAEADLGIGSEPEWISALAFEKLAVDRFVAVFPAADRGVKDKTIRVAELGKRRLITLKPSPSIRRAVEKIFAETGQPFEPRYQVARQTTALGLVEAGLGVALLPEIAIPRSLPRGLHVATVKPPILRSIGIIQRRGDALSPPAARLRNFISRVLRNYRSS